MSSTGSKRLAMRTVSPCERLGIVSGRRDAAQPPFPGLLHGCGGPRKGGCGAAPRPRRLAATMPGSSLRRTSRTATLGLALGALLAVALAPALRGEATEPGTGTPPRVLIDGGALRTWDGTST